jgi:hypothetical protein
VCKKLKVVYNYKKAKKVAIVVAKKVAFNTKKI